MARDTNKKEPPVQKDQFWEAAKKASLEVATWPDWKKGTPSPKQSKPAETTASKKPK